MKRISLIDHLQTIFINLSIFKKSVIYIQEVRTKEVKKIELGNMLNLLNAFKEVDKYIHARYTKVILDCGTNMNNPMLNLIDEKYNNFIERCPLVGIFEDQILEMVEVEVFNPNKKYANEFWKEVE